MNRTHLIMLALIVICGFALIPAVHALTYTDNTDAEFAAGTFNTVNGTNNTLILSWNGTDFGPNGVYTSGVFDMGSNPVSTIAWSFSTPSATTVLVSTRTGPDNPVDGTWSAWSSNYATSAGSTVTSPQARYLQYRIQMGATNTSNTPTITSVTVNSTELGTNITAYAPLYANLTSATVGNYSWVVTITDTYSVVNVTARYKINATGTWSAPVNLTPAGIYYTFDIAPPHTDWYADRGNVLYMNISANATNGVILNSVNQTFTENIEFVPTAPVIDPIQNYSILQNQTLAFGITGSDYDNQSLSWNTSQGGATITSTGNYSATFNWTPNATQSGIFTVVVTANTGLAQKTRSFIVNVTEINYPPSLTAVPAIVGYYGNRQVLVLSAFDYNFGQNLTFSVSPSLFRITATTSNPLSNGSNATPGQWYGLANFTPLDPTRGFHNITLFADDGTVVANTSTAMEIDYCGDGTCQATYETTDTCVADCGSAVETPGLAIVAPDRNCANKTSIITIFDAKDRYSCYYEGRVAGDQAVCSGLEGVNVNLFQVNGSLLTSLGSSTSGTNGTLSFQPGVAGSYRVVAAKDGYQNASATIVVRNCMSDIAAEETNVTITQPPLPVGNGNTGAPKPPETNEQPAVTVPPASLTSLLLFYVFTPVLLASLLYLGNVFYDVNKDTLPWLLEMRIKGFEVRAKAQPTIDKVAVVLRPITGPVGRALAPVKARLQPLVDKMNESIKKDSQPPRP